MSINNIEIAMFEISIGFTTTINGHVVTRWSKEVWEVDTFGRKCQNINEAAQEIAK